MIPARLLCLTGFHRWERYAAGSTKDPVVFTFERCAVAGCPRREEEKLIDVEFGQLPTTPEGATS